MSIGPGKYDDLCTYVREQAKAEGAIVIVFNGSKGHGFSAQLPLPPSELSTIASIFRDVARQIDESAPRI